jgi:predicted methyltransferase
LGSEPGCCRPGRTHEVGHYNSNRHTEDPQIRNTFRADTQETPDYAALIAAPDRSAADRATDARRDPLPILTFIGAHPGMKVLDMGAGSGYSTELMARAVGPNGVVYGQNAPESRLFKLACRRKRLIRSLTM